MKKSIGFFIIGVCLMLIAGPIISGKYLRLDFMDSKVADKRWGHISFDAAKFKAGKENVRASMAFSLVTSKKYIGKAFAAVRTELGPHDGYFDRDSIPAYMIESRKPGEKKDAWQIVFLPDKTGRKVEDVRIHKNCCYSAEEYGSSK